MTVNTGISDLFFEYGYDAKLWGDMGYEPYSYTSVKAAARDFLDLCHGLGVELPTHEELGQDFFERI